MGNPLKLIFAAITLVSVVGCSSSPAALDRKALSTNKVSVIDLTSPEKLTHTMSQKGSTGSSAVLGGAIGALVGASIDAAINAKRANTLVPIVAAMGNYNPQTSFANKLKGISGNSVASNVTVNTSSQAITSAVNALNVRATYALAANHQSVDVKASTALRTKAEGALYKRNFAAKSAIEFGIKDNEKLNATEFLKKNPNKLKAAIESAMNSVVKQISDDINVGETAEAK